MIEDDLAVNGDGRGNAPVVPSVTEMIASSVGAPQGEGTTALDDLHVRIVDTTARANVAPLTGNVEVTPAGKKRDRTGGAQWISPHAAMAQKPVKEKAKTKAALQNELEQAKSSLAEYQARGNVDSVAQLGKTISVFTVLAFGVTAQYRGPHWALTEQEAKDVAETGGIALAKYAVPINEHAPWLMFAGVLGNAIASRVFEENRVNINRATMTDAERANAIADARRINVPHPMQ